MFISLACFCAVWFSLTFAAKAVSPFSVLALFRRERSSSSSVVSHASLLSTFSVGVSLLVIGVCVTVGATIVHSILSIAILIISSICKVNTELIVGRIIEILSFTVMSFICLDG